MEELESEEITALGQNGLYWVGIGASAGGLEALRLLSHHLPENVGATYIVTQHMAAQHKSMLTDLVGRETALPVETITDGLRPKPNTIYITPPNQDLVVEGDTLKLCEPSKEPGAPKPSVNRFFRSLATERRERSIGVILSGTGSDGAYGIQAIRAAGGITIVQDEGSAKYEGMPNAAIETGCADLIMSPEDVGAKFEQIIKAPRDLERLQQSWNSGDDMNDLLHLLLARTRVDFRDYKPPTIRRRIDRRMTALGYARLDDYVNHTRSDPKEVDALFRDFLISVTSFFRDPGEFEILRRSIDELVETLGAGEKRLRIWVAGCATGEEAYSVAILAAEALGGFPNIAKNGLQVFATDIDEAAIEQARRGLYPETALQDLPADYVERYFHRVKDSYQIAKRLREAVMFSYHDVTRDPPFRQIDLVSCRNLLIYFRQSLQERVLARFHYALNPKGLLFLGKSESNTGSAALFRALGDDRPVFQKCGSVVPAKIGAMDYKPAFSDRKSMPVETANERARTDMTAMFDSLVRAVGPNCLLATPDLHLKRAYGDVSRYVALAEGDLKMTVPSLLKPAYAQEVRTLITACQRQKESRLGVVRTDESTPSRREQIRVYPVADEARSEHFLLIVFADWEEEPPQEADLENAPEGTRQHVVELERALALTRESLQQANQELETSNEELQALNEELQSTNEELETANEELQSTNEELTTVNEELHINTQEIEALNHDLTNILSNIGTPFLVVDRDLFVVRSTNEARRLFDLGVQEQKPHLSRCRLPAGFPRIVDHVVDVLESGTPSEQHVLGGQISGNLVIAPYDNAEGRRIGVVILISLTTELTQLQRELKLLFDHLPAGIQIRNKSGEILRANEGASTILGVPLAELEGSHLSDYAYPEAVLVEDREVIKSGESLMGVVHPVTTADGRKRWLRFDRVPFQHPETGDACVYSMTYDVTEAQEVAKALGTSEERFDLALKGSNLGVWDWDLENDTIFWSNHCLKILGVDRGDFTGDPGEFWDRLHPEDKDRIAIARKLHVDRNQPYAAQYRIRRADGTYRWIETRGQAIRDEQGRARRFIGSAEDITERLKDEIAIREQAEKLRLAERMGGIGHWRVDVVENQLYWSDQVYAIHDVDPKSFTPSVESSINFYHPDDRDMVRRVVEDGMKRGEPFEFEARIVRHSGEERYVHSICHVERGGEGAVSALFGVFSDITDQKLQEQERERTLDELSRSNAELTRFSYVCSHDMKQPVRTISMMADLLLDQDNPPDEMERQELLERIGGNAKRLGAMIESLLAFSRIDGKLTTEEVDLSEVVAEVREFLARAAEEAGARFEVEELPVVIGAKTHFRQLFQNLISNALKFAKTGDCLVKITCETAKGGGWEILIEDNGPGVPEDKREEVFEVFKRLHRQDEVEGSGLGLSICRKIVDQYQGRLVCDEGAHGGAAMRIFLPKALARAA